MRHTERGVALIVVMMAMLLMTALGASLVMTTSGETRIAANYRSAQEGLYAADAGLHRSLVDLEALGDWSLASNGTVQSSFIDAGATIDRRSVVNLANCAKTTDCSAADMSRVTADRPWGVNNPQWRLFAYGRLSQLWPAGVPGIEPIDSSCSVVVLVAGAGTGALALRAEAFGWPNGHQRIDATIARSDPAAALRLVSWREIR